MACEVVPAVSVAATSGIFMSIPDYNARERGGALFLTRRRTAKARRDTNDLRVEDAAIVLVSVGELTVCVAESVVESDIGVTVKSWVGLNLAFSRRCIFLAWTSSSILVYVCWQFLERATR